MTVSMTHRVATVVLMCGVATLLAGCVTTTDGTAVRTRNSLPQVTATFDESGMDDLLLSGDEVNTILDAKDMEARDVLDQMTVNPNPVSDRGCLAVLLGAEDAVYAESGWTAVRDQVVDRPQSRNTVEQTVVLYPSAESARKFFDKETAIWRDCSGRTLSMGEGDEMTHWDIHGVRTEDALITQWSVDKEHPEWPCDHALAVASNVVFEAWACGIGVTNQAATIAIDMAAKAATR